MARRHSAFSHSAIKPLLGLDCLTDAPIYALTQLDPANMPVFGGPIDQLVG